MRPATCLTRSPDRFAPLPRHTERAQANMSAAGGLQ